MSHIYDNLLGKAWISPDLFDTLKAEGKLRSELGRLYVYKNYELVIDTKLPPNTIKILKPEVEEEIWDTREKNLEHSLAVLADIMGGSK